MAQRSKRKLTRSSCGREIGFHSRYATPANSKIDSVTPIMDVISVTRLRGKPKSETVEDKEMAGPLDNKNEMLLGRRHGRNLDGRGDLSQQTCL